MARGAARPESDYYDDDEYEYDRPRRELLRHEVWLVCQRLCLRLCLRVVCFVCVSACACLCACLRVPLVFARLRVCLRRCARVSRVESSLVLCAFLRLLSVRASAPP